MSIKIIIADKSQPFVDQFCLFIQEREGMEVIGKAFNEDEIIQMVTELKPNLLFLDIAMFQDGFKTIRHIHTCFPNIKIIILTLYTKKLLIQQSFELGASGFLSKNCICTEIDAAISTILKGNQYVGKY